MSAFTKAKPGATPAPYPPARRGALVVPALLAFLLLVVAVLAAPTLLWAYDIERAGSLIDAGMAWPAPRTASSLPQARDAAALARALPYLDAAVRRRPTHAHAHYLAGQVYAALGDWDRAAAAYEQARALAPGNPLIRWEASLVYARMDQVSQAAPRTDLLERLAVGQLAAPGALIKSLFCTDKGAASCYAGRASYRQPLAADPRGPQISAPVLFLHPPASVSIRLSLPAGQPALRFLAGLDPVAREWRTDGATFRVWVAPAEGPRQLAAELPLDRATALRGWVPGWADLSPWAGQSVTLTLETDAGPRGDSADDWFAWGQPALTTATAARYAAMQPALRARELRQGLR